MIMFFAVEIIYGLAINNLEASFFPAVCAGVAMYIVNACIHGRTHARMDNPPPEPYRVSLNHAYSRIKETIKDCYDPPQRWRITADKQHDGQMQFYFELKERVETSSGRYETITKGITLDVILTRQPDRSTDVQLHWRVNAPTLATRADCDAVIAHTTTEIRLLLQDMEVAKHG